MNKKTIWFKEWVYPILVPLIVTLITLRIITPVPPLLDIVVEEYYEVSPSIDGYLEFAIKNPQQFKINIYTIGYKFSWEDHNPIGMNYTPIKTPTIISEINETNLRQSQIITLNPAGQGEDSIIQRPKIRTPASGANSLEIEIKTDRGTVSKKVTLFVINKNE